MIPFLGTYRHKITIGKDTCTLIFIAALFTIAKTWKQPECPSTDEWIKKIWGKNIYIHNILQNGTLLNKKYVTQQKVYYSIKRMR